MTSNKRIHDLLESINTILKGMPKSTADSNQNPWLIDSICVHTTYFLALKHLLEVDIEKHEGRKFCPLCGEDLNSDYRTFYTSDSFELWRSSKLDINKFDWKLCSECNIKSQQDTEVIKENDS